MFINCCLGEVEGYYGEFVGLVNRLFIGKEDGRGGLEGKSKGGDNMHNVVSSKIKVSRKLPETT